MIKLLLVEDDPRDAEAIQAALSGGGSGQYLEPFEFISARSLQQGLAILREREVDVVLLDLDLPDARDFHGIDRLKREFPTVPMIVLTKQNEETLVALEAVKRGAQDYFSKNQLDDYLSLDRVIRYAIERNKAEKELVLAREAALKASRAKSEFLANMSHDIRTPLNCIIGVSDLLLRSKLSEEDRNHVMMLNRASESLLSLVNNVLDLSKIEAGQVVLGNKEFDLLETASSVLDLVATRAHAKGLEVIFKIEEDVPRSLIGGADILSQVLANLLGNAVKFTKEGEITLSVEVVNRTDSHAELAFSVKDTGVGIPKDKLEAVFDTFTQIDSSDPAIKNEGSGLGLSICRRLVKLMKGRIGVKSTQGKGSEFHFQVPFELGAARAHAQTLPKSGLDAKTILVVDDNLAHGLLLKELLEGWGAKVWLAKDSRTALAMNMSMVTKGKAFDLGLIDLRMPGLRAGGIELVQKIKGQIASLIMMMPTNHRPGDLQLLRKSGIHHYYFKPTKPYQLAQIITKCLKHEIGASDLSAMIDGQGVNAKPLKLLVADDSEDNRLLIEAYCRGSNINLAMAEDGHEALEKVKSTEFDLILMDLQMPRMNGYEALAEIRNWENANQKKNIPVLALTAYALTEEAERCLSAGFDAHVTKPITKTQLITTINRYAV